MNKKRIIPPKWLGRVAQDKYRHFLLALPELDTTQLDMVAMLAVAYETYLQAEDELSKHCQSTGSLCTTGSTGQSTIHPAYKIQTTAIANYLTIARQLRLSLAPATAQAPAASASELNNILGFSGAK